MSEEFEQFVKDEVDEQFIKDEMERAGKIIGSVQEALRTHLADVVRTGWVRMLEVSSFPVFTTRVLEHGFNPRNWFTAAAESVPRLVESVVEKLEGRKPDLHAKPDAVARVLSWDAAVQLLDAVTIKVLGVLWFVDFVLSLPEGVDYPDASIRVWTEAWRLVEKETIKSREEIEDRIAGCVRKLNALEGVIWDEIVQIPAVIT